MTRLTRTASLLVALSLLTSTATAYAECAWVLWGYPDGTVFEPPQANSPPRPLQRTTRVRAPSAPFIIGAYQTRTECMAQPDIGNTDMARKFTLAGGDDVMVGYSAGCLPDTIDPREPKGK